jgi:hypothetical protein
MCVFPFPTRWVDRNAGLEYPATGCALFDTEPYTNHRNLMVEPAIDLLRCCFGG